MPKKVSELLLPAAVILKLNSREKSAVIAELTAPLVTAGLVTSEEEFISAIMRRENLESTGIGFGVAIPHARTNAVREAVIAFGRSETGVDFSSLDGKLSHLIFLIAAPEALKREYIWTLAKLSSLLRQEEVRNGLLQAGSVDEVFAIIGQYERL